MIIPVILSGGVGSRLWPVSRELFPKQFQALVGEQSMFLDTVERAATVAGAGAPIVVCNDEHRFMVAEQLRSAGAEAAAILLEPMGRNTAPAVAIAAHKAKSLDADAILLVMPADHVITDVAAFSAAVAAAESLAAQGRLTTFGIVPDRPETGYGYIRRGNALGTAGSELAEFVEKPDLATAEGYLASGDYLWNSGIFVLSAASYLEQLQQHAPEIAAAAQSAYDQSVADLDFVRVDAEAFEACPSDSIDYAVMEHTSQGAVVALDCGWSDVGAWSALWDIAQRDAEGNMCKGDVLTEDTANCYLRSEGRLLATVGVKDLVVVNTGDAVLVADRHKVQDVKAIVTRLKQEQRNETDTHSRVFRPWGSYESLVSAGRFQVKRIIVSPGQKLSLQMHHHRAEHWIVVSGTATVTCDDKVFTLSEDQSTYIPIGSRHRLENPGVIPLEIIEVQSGSYLGEDDIVRFEDVYGRSPDDAEASS